MSDETPVDMSDQSFLSFLRKKLSALTPKLWALFGVLAVGIGNLAGAIGHLDAAHDFAVDYLGIQSSELLHIILTVVFGLLLLAGYSFVAVWVYVRFVRRRSRRVNFSFKIFAVLAAVLLAIVDINYAFPPNPDVYPVAERIRRDLRRILLLQLEPSGGFRFSRNSNIHDTQVWTSAQILYALLTYKGSTRDHQSDVRRAFEYIERVRLPGPAQGWGYVEGVDWGVTEIAGWVVLATSAALQSEPPIWTSDEASEVIRRLERDLLLIISRQHDDGGWPPVPRTNNPAHLRTYSTVMAVWALTEVRRAGILGDRDSSLYDRAARNGVAWLLSKWHFDPSGQGGWQPNPALNARDEYFPGLSAQVLYVLEAARRVYGHTADEISYMRSRENFLKIANGQIGESFSLRNRPVSSNQRAHDSDRYLTGTQYMVEGSTFLWYPWALAATAGWLVAPSELTADESRLARNLLGSLTRKLNGLWIFAQRDPVAYPAAEALIAINLFIQSASAQTAVPSRGQ
ncbi:terpene cyclase/mutase family protein [Sabulicella rubraurantiaca]|uniref:terpene cyclase/mutase family protein n=1 Tax=Sabulicella rubraurantiaca TaxID=2811429 RepID=UPI001A95D73B|nr:terpene cyclase/mutase family protein [Sabulicella rubraurantiaca]